MRTLTLRLSNGTSLIVPATLHSTTTYVLLEQETWFEKELAFLPHCIEPGMTAIDIGANHGVYSVLLARWVGAAGRVYAYEPASATRAMLEQSRAINGFDQIQILPFALSDSHRGGHLVYGASSETNTLGASGDGEPVEIRSLDGESAIHHWRPDFIKIDAEGEEEKILAGGSSFFKKYSPLVMFEIKAGNTVNRNIAAAFVAMGYKIFSLLDGAPLLVPADVSSKLDDYELNLFAAKPDRMKSLTERGVLVAKTGAWKPGETSKDNALDLLKKQAFAATLGPMLSRDYLRETPYSDCLAAYAAWRNPENPPEDRFAALDFAYRNLSALCISSPNFSRLSTLARIAWERGYRSHAVGTLNSMLEQTKQNSVSLPEPFWPACPRYDSIDPKDQIGRWFAFSIVEQTEKLSAFSSMFGEPTFDLEQISAHQFTSMELGRRNALIQMKNGQTPALTERLLTETADHLNAALWRNREIPTN